jgi:hypothetical protein
MPEKEHHEFDQDSIHLLAENVKRLRAQYHNLAGVIRGLRRENPAINIRTGYTTTDTEHPSYPATGCQFVVRFEDWAFQESVPLCADLDKLEWAQKTKVCRVYGGAYLEEDTRVIIVRVPGKEGRRWWILPIPDKLYKVEAITCFFPGNTDESMKRLQWDPDTEDWTDSGSTVSVWDPDFKNFLIPGERGFVQQLTDSAGDPIYEFIASQGLERMAKTSSEIDCGASDQVNVYHHETQGSCSKTLSSCQVTVCNDWGWSRRIKSGEEIYIGFRERAWIILTHMRNQTIRCTLGTTLCPNDASAVLAGPYKYADACDLLGETPSSAVNDLGMSGQVGDNVVIKYDQDSDEWYVLIVEHKKRDVVVEDDAVNKFLRYQSCGIDGHVLYQASMMSCEDPGWERQITLYERDFVALVTSDAGQTGSGDSVTCPKLKYVPTAMCVFDPDDGQNPLSFFEFEAVDVLVDHQDNGECAQIRPQVICVGYAGPELAWEDFICGNDCVDDSGGS